jgi:hypothetical protein
LVVWFLRRALVLTAVACVALCAIAAAQARVTASLTGTWLCCGGGGAAAQDFVLTASKGSLHGTAKLPSGKAFAKITGTTAGRKVKIITTYLASFSPGYVATFVGTLSANGNKLSGSWKSNANQSGTWVATRRGHSG